MARTGGVPARWLHMKHIALALPLLAACSATTVVVERSKTISTTARIDLKSNVDAEVRVTRDGVPVYDDTLRGAACLVDLEPGRYRVAVNGRQVRRSEFDLLVANGWVSTVSVARNREGSDEVRSGGRVGWWILAAPIRLIGWLFLEVFSRALDGNRAKSSKRECTKPSKAPNGGPPVKW